MSGLIYKKMSDVMKDIGAVTKAQTNTAQGFKFRGIDQFVNAMHPALIKHGVFMTPRAVSYTQELKDVTRSNGKQAVDKHVAIQMEYDFFAEDGSKVTIGPIPAEGLDSGDKATNKALSAALKYALIQTFSVPTEDMAEADLESPEIGASIKANSVTVTTSGSSASGTVAVTTKPVSSFKRDTTKKEAVASTTAPAPTATKAPATNGAAKPTVTADSGWEN